MTAFVHPTDLELAAMIASKICHDVIGPVGAINNGLEILTEEDEKSAQDYALTVIRNVTEQASNRLQYARFAFGATGSAGALIDLATTEQISRGYLDRAKHKLVWRGFAGHMIKDRVKLLLNLVACAVTALPRGGEIEVIMAGSTEKPSFVLRCRGTGAKPPQYLPDFIAGTPEKPLDALSVQAYYAWRLAQNTGMILNVVKDADDIIISALLLDATGNTIGG